MSWGFPGCFHLLELHHILDGFEKQLKCILSRRSSLMTFPIRTIFFIIIIRLHSLMFSLFEELTLLRRPTSLV